MTWEWVISVFLLSFASLSLPLYTIGLFAAFESFFPKSYHYSSFFIRSLSKSHSIIVEFSPIRTDAPHPNLFFFFLYLKCKSLIFYTIFFSFRPVAMLYTHTDARIKNIYSICIRLPLCAGFHTLHISIYMYSKCIYFF